MEIFHSRKLTNSFAPYAKATIIESTVFFSGQVALDDNGYLIDGGIAKEAEKLFENIDILLEELDIPKKNISKMNIYIVRMGVENFSHFNEVYKNWVGHHRPARTAIGVYSLPKSANLEIEFIAEKRGV
ncbi:hypothetical protein A9261_15175 [Vibrio tasmaniensis]|nr:hypothetical protein A9261_15175 [Vibrio tasmaniensis]